MIQQVGQRPADGYVELSLALAIPCQLRMLSSNGPTASWVPNEPRRRSCNELLARSRSDLEIEADDQGERRRWVCVSTTQPTHEARASSRCCGYTSVQPVAWLVLLEGPQPEILSCRVAGYEHQRLCGMGTLASKPTDITLLGQDGHSRTVPRQSVLHVQISILPSTVPKRLPEAHGGPGDP